MATDYATAAGHTHDLDEVEFVEWRDTDIWVPWRLKRSLVLRAPARKGAKPDRPQDFTAFELNEVLFRHPIKVHLDGRVQARTDRTLFRGLRLAGGGWEDAQTSGRSLFPVNAGFQSWTGKLEARSRARVEEFARVGFEASRKTEAEEGIEG